MTKEREEAIKLLTQYIDYDAETPDYYEMENACKVALKVLKQQPCEDCISRAEAQKRISIRLYESALNIVDYDCKTSDVFKDIAEKLSTCISEIPSIQPKPKTDVLDKIRAEIENDWQLKKYPSSPFACGLRRAIEIIDKYKAESEETE